MNNLIRLTGRVTSIATRQLNEGNDAKYIILNVDGNFFPMLHSNDFLIRLLDDMDVPECDSYITLYGELNRDYNSNDETWKTPCFIVAKKIINESDADIYMVGNCSGNNIFRTVDYFATKEEAVDAMQKCALDEYNFYKKICSDATITKEEDLNINRLTIRTKQSTIDDLQIVSYWHVNSITPSQFHI